MGDMIRKLKGADRVRLRPAVIFGDDGIDGAEQAAEMIMNIMVSECRHGFADRLIITYYKDHSVRFQDNGRGIYLGSNDNNSWKNIFCELFAGGYLEKEIEKGYNFSLVEKTGCVPSHKYEEETYDDLCLCAVQYASAFMDATICRDSEIYTLHFEKGNNIGGLIHIGSSSESGTNIHFRLDPEVFSSIDIPNSFFIKHAHRLALLIPNARIVVRIENEHGFDEEVFSYHGGLTEYLAKQEADSSSSLVFYSELEAEGQERYNRPRYGAKIQVALSFCKSGGFVEVYHNWRLLSHGGTHIDRLLQVIMNQVEWKLDCVVDSTSLATHLRLVVNTSTSKFGSSWVNGARKAINNILITDMAEDCLGYDFEMYLKRNKQHIQELIQCNVSEE